MNLDLAQVADAITDGRGRCSRVHLFGRPSTGTGSRGACPTASRSLEDAAGALGARARDAPAAASARSAASRSTRARSSRRARAARSRPRTTSSPTRSAACATTGSSRAATSRSRRPGPNYRLGDILCAVGIPQLRRLDELLAARARIAAAYTERLAGVVATPSADEGDVHGWQAYVVQLDRRDEALRALREQGIEAQIGTYALHRLAAYREQGSFPGADAAYERALALPFHTRLTDAELDRVADALRPFA